MTQRAFTLKRYIFTCAICYEFLVSLWLFSTEVFILFREHAPKYPGHLICRGIEQQQQQKLLISFIFATGIPSYSMFLHSVKWKMRKSSN